MAQLKINEIRELTPKQIEEKLTELENDLGKMKSQVRSGGAPENSAKMRGIRRTIARLKTIYKQKSSN